MSLNKNKDFEKVKEVGHKRVGKTCLVSYTHTGKDSLRVGIKVLKKLGNAPYRNRIKRILRELLRNLPENQAKGCDVVIVVRPKYSGSPNFEQILKKEVSRHMYDLYRFDQKSN